MSRVDTVKEVGQASVIRVTFLVGLPLQANCRIEIQVPSGMLQDGVVTSIVSADASSSTPVVDLSSNLLSISGCPSAITDPTHTFTIDIDKLKNLEYVMPTESF